MAAREREGAYVWAAQAAAARRAGVREEAIDLIRAKGDPATLPLEEREIVAYAQQLVRTNRVDQATFDALQKKYGTQWLVELTAAAELLRAPVRHRQRLRGGGAPDGDPIAGRR